jgi:glycosyltransferase involved in cell wall biosynthesis
MSRRASNRNDPKAIIFVWNNIGPIHADRCEAVSQYYAGERAVIGIELASDDDIYQRDPLPPTSFRKLTLFGDAKIGDIPLVSRVFKTLQTCLRQGAADVFLCYYEHAATWIVATVLRLCGRRVYVMNNSKFDDKERHLIREAIKSIVFIPYCGALVSGARAKSYLAFLGIAESKIELGYNTLSIRRIRELAKTSPAPAGRGFKDRHFTTVSRLVPKKNLFFLLDAYRKYANQVSEPRLLHLVGYGPLEIELKERIKQLKLEPLVLMRGSLPNEQVCELLASTLVLILPSIEEQFGNVVIEAQAMGLPVIISDNCGCWDHLVRSGVNGFAVEPDNVEGLALYMSWLSTDETLWRSMSEATAEVNVLGDVESFIRGVSKLIGVPAIPRITELSIAGARTN